MNPILIVEDKYNGHHQAHLLLLCEALMARKQNVVLLATEEIKNTLLFPTLLQFAPNLTIRYLKGNSFGENGKPTQKDFQEINSVIHELCPVHVYLITLDNWISVLIQSYLLKGGRAFAAPWSSIYLGPTIDYTRYGGIQAKTESSIRSRLRDMGRMLALFLLSHDSNLRCLHLFDEYAVDYLTKTMKRDKFDLIADPVEAAFYETDYDQEELKKRFGISQNDYLFITFGFHNRKKGTAALIAAFRKLREQPGFEATRLLIAGQLADPRIHAELENPATRRLIESGALIIENRILSIDESVDCLKAADCVCIPYEGFYGTSGVLIKSYVLGKQVVCSEENWMGLFAKNVWGELCSPENVDSIRQAMSNAFMSKPNKLFDRREEFHSSRFQQGLLNDLEDVAA
ncbi:MAG: glycosyltransferase [bacterium]